MRLSELVAKAAAFLNLQTPEQKQAKIADLAESLNAYNRILDDMVWQEGNLQPREVYGRSPALDYLSVLNLTTTSIDTRPGAVNFVGHPIGFPSHAHFGMVRELRKQFKKYSKEEFRELSKEPVVKAILTGSAKLSTEEIAERIKEHLDNIE